jgi:hypothetical protein
MRPEDMSLVYALMSGTGFREAKYLLHLVQCGIRLKVEESFVNG